MKQEFITLATKNPNGSRRNVTISCADGRAHLLGNLEHNTLLLIDQEFVNNLQELLDYRYIELVIKKGIDYVEKNPQKLDQLGEEEE